MAWISDVISGATITASLFNSVKNGISAWLGDVNAGGYDLLNVGNITFASGGAYGSGTVYRYDATITAAKQVTMADLTPAVTTPTEGSTLTVIIAQDATGSRALTWSSDFHGAESWTGAANEMGIWTFTARANNDWYMTSQPVIGITS